MAYTIVKSDGTVLTTIADGTINTTSTSLALPGRNYAGYGQSQDTNFVHVLENFADTTPPSNPLRGQLWYNTNTSTLCVCPTDGETNAAAWLVLATASSGGSTTFGELTVTGNITANNISATNNISANAITASYLTISANATIADANITTANIGTLQTTAITTGSASTPGSLTGTWTVTGTASGNALVLNGNLYISNSSGANIYGIKTDKYMYANGDPISFAGSYGNTNVALYLPVYNGIVGNVAVGANATFRGNLLTTGSSANAGTVTGNWTLSTGSRLQATYADLAERAHADSLLPVGTIVKVGGINEVTKTTASDLNNVLGVVSENYAFLMNAEAGPSSTHPAIALIGRVPVRVIGPINKGDKITVTDNGCAIKSLDDFGFGWAIESNLAEEEKLVECIIK